MRDADELWKATIENQRSRDVATVEEQSEPHQEALEVWRRFDLDAKRFRGSTSKGPVWSDVTRRVTPDIDTNQIIADEQITPGMTVHQVHRKLPTGVKNIETMLIYKKVSGHPQPGEPFDEQKLVASPSKASQSSEAPILGREEDSRLIDVGLKRSLDEPTFDRTSQRSKIFGLWRADDHTEWGDKKRHPVIANCRDLKLFHRLETADMYYALLEPESSLTYLTKQSGKELNEKKIPAHERKLFDKAKILEITNLVNSNAIQIVGSCLQDSL